MVIIVISKRRCIITTFSLEGNRDQTATEKTPTAIGCRSSLSIDYRAIIDPVHFAVLRM